MTLHRITSKALMNILHPRGLPEMEARLLLALASARGAYVSRDELVEILYSDDEDGGAMEAWGTIRIYVYRLRAKGYDIRARYGWGYALNTAGAPERKRAA